MATYPNLLQALVAELSFPRTYTDAGRNAAALELRAMSYSVHQGGRPQGSKDLGIVLELAGGVPMPLADTATKSAQSVVELSFWSRDTAANRAGATTLWQLMERVRVLLLGMNRPASGDEAQIENIFLESEYFQTDAPPVNASDGWQARFSINYLVFWQRAAAQKVTVI